jgi:hypothetical protein
MNSGSDGSTSSYAPLRNGLARSNLVGSSEFAIACCCEEELFLQRIGSATKLQLGKGESWEEFVEEIGLDRSIETLHGVRRI